MWYFLILRIKEKKIGRIFVLIREKNEDFKIYNLHAVNNFNFIWLQLLLGVSDLSRLFSNVLAGIELSNDPWDLSIT